MTYYVWRFLLVLAMSIPVNILLRMATGAEGFWGGFLVGYVAFMCTDIHITLWEARRERP